MLRFFHNAMSFLVRLLMGPPSPHTVPIQHRPLENNEVQCWICLDSETHATMDAVHAAGFIQPCLCSGSMRWVHRTCLDTLRDSHRMGRGFTQCLNCTSVFEYEYVDENDPSHPGNRRFMRWCWFLWQMFLDIGLFVVVWHLLLVLITAFTITFDTKNVLLQLMGIKEADSMLGMLGYYLWSTVIAFAIVGLVAVVCMMVVGCQGNHNNAISIGECSPACMLVTLLVLASIGLVVGVVVACQWLGVRAQLHMQKVWWISEARLKRVRDLSLVA